MLTKTFFMAQVNERPKEYFSASKNKIRRTPNQMEGELRFTFFKMEYLLLLPVAYSKVFFSGAAIAAPHFTTHTTLEHYFFNHFKLISKWQTKISKVPY